MVGLIAGVRLNPVGANRLCRFVAVALQLRATRSKGTHRRWVFLMVGLIAGVRLNPVGANRLCRFVAVALQLRATRSKGTRRRWVLLISVVRDST